MKDRETGENKGYAFVAFKTKDVAQQAIEELHGKEFKGKTLRCSLSETKHRLFIGNVPKSWTEEEFRKVVEEDGPGVENIELIKVKPSRSAQKAPKQFQPFDRSETIHLRSSVLGCWKWRDRTIDAKNGPIQRLKRCKSRSKGGGGERTQRAPIGVFPMSSGAALLGASWSAAEKATLAGVAAGSG